jgi:hypothetical protein
VTPRGFTTRKGSRLLRSHVDLPEDEARAVVAIADAEQAATGEPVSPQVVIRRFVRLGLRARLVNTVPPSEP